MKENSKSLVGLYFKDISKLQTLNDKETTYLFKRLRDGDCSVKNEIIISNLRLVISIAKKYIGLGIPLLDLIGEGNKGLFRAVKKFNLDKKCQFSTYATIWIRQYILRCIAKQSKIVRPAINRYYRTNKVSKILKELSPNISHKKFREILKRSGLNEEDIENFLAKKNNFVHTEIYYKNLDFILKDDPQVNITPFDHVREREISSILEIAKEELNDEEYRVIEFRFSKQHEKKTLEQIGRVFHVTRERIRQIEVTSLRKLKKFLNHQNINSLNDIL